jgi:hypothetical protein
MRSISRASDAGRRNSRLAPRLGEGAPGGTAGTGSRPHGVILCRHDPRRGHRPTCSPAELPRNVELAHRVPLGSGDPGIDLGLERSGLLAAVVLLDTLQRRLAGAVASQARSRDARATSQGTVFPVLRPRCARSMSTGASEIRR